MQAAPAILPVMTGRWLVGIFALGTIPASLGQVTPAHPDRFITRPIGDAAKTGAEIVPQEKKVRQVTYFVLSEARPWTSADGKPVSGKLIAFENLVVEMNNGAETTPEPPRHPTVVKDGKIRLLVQQKPFEVPVARLSEPDQQFIARIRERHAKPPGS